MAATCSSLWIFVFISVSVLELLSTLPATAEAAVKKHGLKQYRNGWADGPAYITQCPIQSGESYAYDFNVTGQRGTLWWHAHILWLRATVYGAIVILPRAGVPFPFPQPDAEAELILDTYALEVEWGKTYLLRIINAALNDELFFSIAGHNMMVVEIDAVYCKPFTTAALLIAPGQTTNVLFRSDQPPGRYFMAARPFNDAPIPVDNRTAAAILQYQGVPPSVIPSFPRLPSPNDSHFARAYNAKLRSLNSPLFPANVPQTVDRRLFYTIGLGHNPCPTCLNGTRFAASLNNISFVMPEMGLLQAHYFNITGVFRQDFPDRPPKPFNYTGAPLTANLGTSVGTRLSRLRFNSTVELVLQDTNLLTVESHPFHLHGYNFFVVGIGTGNFDPAKDPAKFNLVDPPERNTVGVPTGGWTAIRFRADNPGVWFMHCHLELHTMWGLKMAFVVENGKSDEQSVLPPPQDLPRC
ncbi:Laccase-11 [Apostasia shenzhenica]|uniref:Laccase n=1 Tax=Apostasia shenzhenica TaxID=1088818 RepID=A0A2I0BFJ4_9ASPA|nr:Laccase-11 [Apostasia shenzhenica]